jgi:hypothetical protein
MSGPLSVIEKGIRLAVLGTVQLYGNSGFMTEKIQYIVRYNFLPPKAWTTIS